MKDTDTNQIELAKRLLESKGYKVSEKLYEMSSPSSKSLAAKLFNKLSIPLPVENNDNNVSYVIKYPKRNLVIYAQANIRKPAKDGVIPADHVNSIRFDKGDLRGENIIPDLLKIKSVSDWTDSELSDVANSLNAKANSLGIDLKSSQ